MNIETWPIDKVKPYENNPRHNDKAVDATAASIEAFDWQQPIVVDTDGIIIAGHTRYKAARKLGMTEVPVHIFTGTKEEADAYRLADNKTGELAEWDLAKLKAELEAIQTIDMASFGFEPAEISLDDVVDDDFTPEPPDEPVTKQGDLYKLGDHRLYCGDATNLEHVAILMGGGVADMLLTDPPYNIDYQGGTADKLKIKNDAWESASAFREFLVAAFLAAKKNMKPGAAFYIWHADTESQNFKQAATDAGLDVRQVLIWNKASFTLGRQDYQWKHEPCLYGWKDGAAHYFTPERNIATVLGDEEVNIDKLTKDEARDLLHRMMDNLEPDVLFEKKPSRSEQHPTMKPVQLMARQIHNSTKPGEIVLDLFGGSGSTMIACEQLGRKCMMLELDPHYCDVIIERWETFTGRKAEKL